MATILDLGSRQIVGMAMVDHLRTELVEATLEMAFIQRCPPTGLLHLSDRGTQYTSQAYRHRLAERDVTLSMSRTGQCLDNAHLERFLGHAQT
jgi:putative transposase